MNPSQRFYFAFAASVVSWITAITAILFSGGEMFHLYFMTSLMSILWTIVISVTFVLTVIIFYGLLYAAEGWHT